MLGTIKELNINFGYTKIPKQLISMANHNPAHHSFAGEASASDKLSHMANNNSHWQGVSGLHGPWE